MAESRKTRKQKRKGYNRHHRKPRCRGGTNSISNISHVLITKHRAFHTLFGTMDAHQIAHELNTVWIDPDYFIVVRRT